ncbi:MAG TPA: hypothetical protein VKY22_09045 [Bradyrhizobium sp.]|nr:hypothetical protein [Bradyrhizobium sp.]
MPIATVIAAKLSASLGLERQPLGRQDHTPLPSASVPLVNRHIRVHRIPHHGRDDRDAPLSIGAERHELDHVFLKIEIYLFSRAGLERAIGLMGQAKFKASRMRLRA